MILSMKEKRFTGMNKTKRDRQVKRFAERHPDATQTEIAQQFNVSPAMIGKILKESSNAK
jgi:hypothetical protein